MKFDKIVTAIDFTPHEPHTCAMTIRWIPASLFVTILSALGCGGVSSPPDQASSAVMSESAHDAPASACDAPNCRDAAKSPAEPVEEHMPASSDSNPSAVEDKPVASTATSDIPGANISVGRLEADGLVTKDIECKSEGGGLALLGMVLVTAWMSPQKSALDACAPAGSETRVVWRARGGKLTEISAKGNANTKACVERALRPGKPMFDGHCAATIEHGKR